MKGAIRLVHGLSRRVNTKALSRDAGLLNVRKHLYLRQLMLLRTVLMTGRPVFLGNSIRRYAPSRALRSTQAGALVIPRTRRKIADGAFSVMGPRLWNNLPPDLRLSDLSDFGARCGHWLKDNDLLS